MKKHTKFLVILLVLSTVFMGYRIRYKNQIVYEEETRQTNDNVDGRFRVRYYDYQRNVSIKVLFDNGHGQYYNASKVSNFLRDIERTFWVEVDVNYGALTDSLLANYSILILLDINETTNPLSTDEINAIKNFVNNGGALLICGDWYKYFDPYYFNAITSSYGIKWYDVSVYDETNYDYRYWYPLIHTWGSGNIASNVSDESLFTVKFSGTALNITDSSVEIVGTGDSDTYAKDESGAIVLSGTDVVVFAAVDLENGGRIFASGSSAFLYESIYLYNNFNFDNKEFALSVMEWLLKEFVDDLFDIAKGNNDRVTLFTGPDNSYEALKKFLLSANESLYITVYRFTSNPIYDILYQLKQQKPNIDIKVILDKYGTNQNMADRLVNELGATVRWASSYYNRTHAKFVIIDNKTCLITSGNFENYSFPYINTKGHRDFGIITNNKYVVDLFLEIFLDDFSMADPYTPITPYTPGEYGEPYTPKFNYNTIYVNANYIPVCTPEGAYYHIRRLIKRAKHFIYLLLPYASETLRLVKRLINDIGNATNRGVSVLVITNDTSFKTQLEAKGANVILFDPINPSFPYPHGKLLIVDDKIVYVGSNNWSGTGLAISTGDKNREAGIAVKSIDAAVYFRDVFGYDWEMGTGSFDSDGDGLSDIYEQDHGLNANNNDTDGDGYSDWEEVVIYDSDPLNASSPGNTPPNVEIISPPDGSTLNTSTILVEWNAYDEDGIDYSEVRLDDGAWINVGNSTQYTFYDVGDGQHTIYVRATDTTGLSNTTYVVVNVSAPPSVSINNDYEGENGNYTIYNSMGTITIGWSASDNSGVDHAEVRLDGGAWENIGNISCYTISGLSEGNHTLELKVVDIYGNYNLTTINIVVDYTPPVIYTEADTYSIAASDNQITISWSASDNIAVDYYMVKIANGSWIYVGTNTSITIQNNMDDGIYAIYIMAVDKAGNYNISYSCLIVDNTPPDIDILSPRNNSYVGSEVVVSWNMSDNMGVVDSYIRIDGGESISVGRETSIKISLTEGEHLVEIIVVDVVGNNITRKIRLYVDLTPPQIEILNPSDGQILSISTITISWNASDNFEVKYYLIRINDGKWISTNDTQYVVTLSDGTYTATVRAYDAAGNYAESTIVFIVDTSTRIQNTNIQTHTTTHSTDPSLCLVMTHDGSIIADVVIGGSKIPIT